MSLILDALSRAEREKRAPDDVPDILTPAPAMQGRAQKPWLPWPLLLGLLAAVTLVCILLLLPGKDDAAPSASGSAQQKDATSTVSARQQTARSTEPAKAAARPERARTIPGNTSRGINDRRAPVQETGQSLPADSARIAKEAKDANEAVANLYSRHSTVADERSPKSGDADRQLTGTSTAEAAREVAQSNDAQVADAPSPQREETPIDLEQVLREARAATADARLSEHPTPLLGALSQQFRNRVPTLMYLRHDYAGSGSSEVVLNGETLRRGQRTGSVQVVEILPDSVLLRFDGEEFRLRALNSWVNL